MDPLLRQFLSPNTQTEFRERVAALEDTKTWERFAALQWDYLRSSYQRLDYGASAVKGIIQGLAQ